MITNNNKIINCSKILSIKKAIIFTLLIVMIISITSCSKMEATELFDTAGLTTENIKQWSMDIAYIGETRGTGDNIYTKVTSENPAFVKLINMLYGATSVDKPDYIFSAEAMCQYRIDLFHDDKEIPAVTFYFLASGESGLLTYVTRTVDENNITTINYDFFIPNGDLGKELVAHRIDAIEPIDELAIAFISRPEIISSITSEELEYFRPEVELEDETTNTAIDFEFYHDEKPKDDVTNSQLYSNYTLETLGENQYLVVARQTSKIGEVIDLLITEVRYNDSFTLVFVDYPDMEMLEEFGLEVDNAIIIEKEDIPLDKLIVFLDSDDDIVDVIDPSVELR